MKKWLIWTATAALAVAITLHLTAPRPRLERFQGLGQKYDVRILRDSWGVPHIFGKTDPDVAFGLAYAHSEDDFATIQGALLAAKGKLASVFGRNAAANDYMVGLLRIRELIEEKYESALEPATRSLCEAYADGLNYYAARHPADALAPLYPVSGKDIVAGFLHKVPLFFGMDRVLRSLFERDPPAEAAPAPPAGSNAFAVSPKRSADGQTLLAINSHQPWEGPVTWYEVHLHSDSGWDMAGGLFPGSPIVLHGHNRYLGWAHTVNAPDLLDVFRLEINPENLRQYRLDGKWRDLEVRELPISVKLLGPFRWTFHREVCWSVFGPVVRRPQGTFAVRYAGMDRIGAVEQWYQMNRATNHEQWENAMRRQQIPMFNVVYADAAGHIEYIYNALLPLRAPGADWSGIIAAGADSLEWRTYLPFAKLPRVSNPASGFVQNCNSSPFHTTIGAENPDSSAYDQKFAIERWMTNRALRALELFGADSSITPQAFAAYKFDQRYALHSSVARWIARLRSLTIDDSLTAAARDALLQWDLGTGPHNRGAALGVLTFMPFLNGHPGEPADSGLVSRLQEAARSLTVAFGRLDVEWRQVNRLRRGNLDLGLGGGPDILNAVYGRKVGPAKLLGRAGDSYIMLVSWDRQGSVSSQSIHQYGTATLDTKSPHYADQAPLFVRQQLKPVWLDETEIRRHLEREYRPGGEELPE